MTRSPISEYCTGGMTQRQEPSALGRIVELVRDLRNRCSWDRAQTRATLRPYLVEEVLELDHALAANDADAIKQEVGDVLLHVAFQIVLGEETGEFGSEDVTNAIVTKMKRRHPHLFDLGDEPETWERQKLRESSSTASILDGLPPTLPAILMAYRLQERAAGVGFDWPDTDGPRAKISEELTELDQEIENGQDTGRVEAEIGDLLFSIVNLARKIGCDPRAALEKANQKFERRFRDVERLAAERDVDVGRASLEELEVLWKEAKQSG
ncbi:MAG: nucleoside triphosphate pyrophosphohydrolase [Gemmatimonadetes bacterium]|nr:nucleoside triphosphate pyrophosphohydrolase [Gemmatimonadota bacterium]